VKTFKEWLDDIIQEADGTPPQPLTPQQNFAVQDTAIKSLANQLKTKPIAQKKLDPNKMSKTIVTDVLKANNPNLKNADTAQIEKATSDIISAIGGKP